MAISVGLGAVAVKNRVDSYPGLGQRGKRHRLQNVVTSTADASGRFPYPDATFDAAPDEPQQTRAKRNSHLWIGVSRDLLITS